MYPLTRFLVLSSFSISVVAGCALTNSHVEPAPVSTTASPSAHGRARDVIVVAPFEDAREEKSRCGLKRNGFGMETADVLCSVPPERWVADELAARLTREGYRVLSADAKPGPSTIIVRGTLKKLFAESTMEGVMQGDASVALVMTTPSGFRAEKEIVVRVKGPLTIGEDPWAGTVTHATANLAIDMATAIDDALLKLDGPT